MRSLQQYVAGIEFPPFADLAWASGPWIGLQTLKETMEALPPIYRREDAESALATTELMTAIEHSEATAALDSLWADFAGWRGPKP
jgi:hypothetical protein